MKSCTKWRIKTILSFIWHPVLSSQIKKRGAVTFYICRGLTINNPRLVSVGKEFYLGRDSRIHFIREYHGETYSPFLTIGNNVDIGQRFTALCAAPITIKDNSLLASDILITSENHGMNPEIDSPYAKQPLSAKPVSIGEGCWIGEKVSIMPGVTLGKKTIVAANSVVTKSFPEYSLIGGAPAKMIKRYNFITHQWERI